MVKRLTIPREFVRAYLKAKGYQEAGRFVCSKCNNETEYLERPEHPIKWLWKHRKHDPYFFLCHTWNRQIGRDTGEVEHWYRWILVDVNWEKKAFIGEIEEQGSEEFDDEDAVGRKIFEVPFEPSLKALN